MYVILKSEDTKLEVELASTSYVPDSLQGLRGCVQRAD